ncbi:MAG: PorT family protein [Flavobacteriaceae bacterium]|nr:PorT family protein [Flavobacteriaceae bacterium]
MKKVLFLSLAVIFSLNVTAQTKGDLEFGFHLGGNLSTISTFDNYDSASSRFSFNTGGFLDFYFNEQWSILLKAQYDEKGWNNGFYEDENFNTFDTDYSLNYITTPLMANFHFGRNYNWFINFGPYVGFLVDAKALDVDVEVKDAFNSTDFGIALGMGVKVPVSDKAKILFEYQAQSGFAEIFDVNDGETIRNGRSSLNVGIVFLLSTANVK